MNKCLYFVGRTDEICIFVFAALFFGGWAFVGKESVITIGSGLAMIGSMLIWFVIAALGEIVKLSECDDEDFYDEEE